MKKYWAIAVMLALVACDRFGRDILFSEPLPMGSRDLARFAGLHQGLYVQADDTLHQLQVLPRTVLLRTWSNYGRVGRAAVDSLRRGARELTESGAWGLSWHLHAEPMGADSARVSLLTIDTLFQLTDSTRHRLRWRGGYYYLNTADSTDGTWETRRLSVRGHRLWLADFGSDSTHRTALRRLLALPDVPLSGAYVIQLSPRNQPLLLRASELWRADAPFYRR